MSKEFWAGRCNTRPISIMFTHFVEILLLVYLYLGEQRKNENTSSCLTKQCLACMSLFASSIVIEINKTNESSFVKMM